MEGINLTDYFSKISDIRGKILSKHKDDIQKLPIYQDRVSQSKKVSQRINHGSLSKGVINKEPLHQRNEYQNINNRVKQLDLVNNRIRNALSSKIKPSVNMKPQQNVEKNKFDYLRSTLNQQFAANNQNIIAPKKTLITEKQSTASRQLQKEADLFKLANKNINPQEDQKVANKKPIDSKITYQLNTSIINKLQEKIAYKINEIQENNSKEVHTVSPILIKTNQLKQAQKFISQLGLKNLPNELKMRIHQNISPIEQKLISLFLMQVELDKKLRQYKQLYQYNDNKDKSQILRSVLSKKGMNLQHQNFQNQIKFNLEECDPFSNLKSNQSFSFDNFALVIIRSKEHWQKNFQKSIDLKDLQQQQFSIKTIDTANKGYISIEDLICYVNMNSKSSLRNRDMILIFKRLIGLSNKNEKNRLEYVTFLDFITI